MTFAPNSIISEDLYDLEDSDRTCFLCDKPDYTLVYDISHFDLPFRFQRCQCGLVKQTPMPNEAFFKWFFNSGVFFSSRKTDKDDIWGYYDYFSDEPSRLATSKRRFRKLAALFDGGPKSIMKVGPGTGTFLHVAQQAGHTARGCDISNEFVNYAKERYDVDIDNGRFEAMDYEDESFDVLLLFNVIENIPNLDEFLEAVYRTLKPGGYFVLNVVDMKNNLMAAWQKDKYFIYRPPICYIFDRHTIRATLEKYGFTLIGQHLDIRTMTPEKIATLLRQPGLLKGEVT
ncbi:MAG: methyltransferase domain-containing protein, partial [Verrucomicrobiota bacterium]